MIAIIDYRMGNVGSMANALKKIGVEAQITSDQRTILAADQLILPGVGAFDNGMENLAKLKLLDVLAEAVLQQNKPILGVCLGMELFTKSSEEGVSAGLGWLDARTVRFNFSADQPPLKVPHMGWNEISVRRDHDLFHGFMGRVPRFYFAHSYHVVPSSSQDIVAESMYGYPFVAAVQHDNILGVQFHPEKSHWYGITLLRNFASLPLSANKAKV